MEIATMAGLAVDYGMRAPASCFSPAFSIETPGKWLSALDANCLGYEVLVCKCDNNDRNRKKAPGLTISTGVGGMEAPARPSRAHGFKTL